MSVTSGRLDRTFFADLAEWLVIAVAAALPWSTSIAGICIAAWLITLLPTLRPIAIRREILTPAGGIPVLLWCLAAIGIFWSHVDWYSRFAGLGSFNRLLCIPLLFAQFRFSGHGIRVAFAFLISSSLLLVASFILVLAPGLVWRGIYNGVPVHDYIFQSSEFLVCGFGALGLFKRSKRSGALVNWIIVSLGCLFLLNFAFSTISRASLAVAPVLLLMLGWRLAGWKGTAGACVVGAIVGSIYWVGSPSLRSRLEQSVADARSFQAADTISPTSLHEVFLEESAAIISSAPIFGYGTGSIAKEFRLITAGQTGARGVATVNPHNQTFAVAIQIGLVGAGLLWAMWIAHLLLFRGGSVTAWIGAVVVVENVISSAVHSHLFDFSNGWLYVFGVGVFGGTVKWRNQNCQLEKGTSQSSARVPGSGVTQRLAVGGR